MFFGMLKKKKKRNLKDIDVDEISLVDAPANRLRFAVIKKDQSAVTELAELLSAFFADEEDREAAIADMLEKVGDLPADAASTIAAALKLLTKYLDGMPDDVQAAVKLLTRKFPASGTYGVPPATDKEPPDGSPEERLAKGKKFLPSEGTLSDVVEAIVAPARPDLVTRWQETRLRKLAKAEGVDLDADEIIDERTGPPHGASKVIKGQDSPDAGDEIDHWPSL